MSKDYLQRLVFEEISARAVVVHLDEVVAEVLSRDSYPPAVSTLLGEALLVVALLSSGIKFQGRVSLQLQGHAGLKLLMADCSHDGGLRGIARIDEDVALPEGRDELFESLARGGILTLTLDPSDGGQRWQGIVPLEGASLATAVEAYFERSEQLTTRVFLGQDAGRAGALMLQQMPGASDDPDGWNRLEQLAATVKREELLELEAQSLFQRLFHEEQCRLFEASPLRFDCPCNRERVMNVLISLGAAELAVLAEEQEVVEVKCQFCNQAYHFDSVDVAALGRDGEAPELDDPTIH
ncbi:MAG: Hsp33 family molecular chaperone HslO [Wenzhouxiangella sp.]